MRILFLGTPDFAVPALEALATTNHEIVGVVTQPDRMRNRNKVTYSPVKECALNLGLPVYQYERISREGVEDIKSLNVDLMITCAFGQILSREILAIPPKGIINVHASLLPKYRGSSPIQWAILNGEKETGISIMRTAYEVDSGDVLLQLKTEIGEEETAGELFDRLSELGAKALLQGLQLIENGEDVYTPQDHSKMSYYPMLEKKDGLIDFNKDYSELDSFIRGMNPWPSAFTFYNGKLFKVFKIKKYDDKITDSYGEIVKASNKDGLIVQIGDCHIEIVESQVEGSRRMDTRSYLLGHSFDAGSILGK